MRKLPILIALATLIVLAICARADESHLWGGDAYYGNEVTIDGVQQYFNTDSGWFRNDGLHDAGNQNYITGYCSWSNCDPAGYFHGYFSFDLTKFAGNANTASFTVKNNYVGPSQGTLLLYGTSLMPSDVDSSQNWFDVGKYKALNAGPVIGSIFLVHEDGFSSSTITLNADGIAWLDAHAGEGAVMGTAFPAALPGRGVPEPGSMILLGSGLIGGIGVLRRKLC